MANLKIFNGTFQLTSLGCSEVTVSGWNPQFRIHGQVCHFIGELLPSKNLTTQFLQIFFIYGNEEIKVNVRRDIVQGLHQNIVEEIQNEWHKVYFNILEFKTAHECALQNGLEKLQHHHS